MRGSSLQARAERQATACPPTGNSHEILRLAHAAYAGEPVLARRDDLLSCRGAASPGNATERGHVSDSRPGRGIVGRQGCRLACRSRRQGRHKVGGPGTAPSAGCHASVLYRPLGRGAPRHRPGPRRYPRRWSTAPTGETEPQRLSLPNGVAFSSLARRTWSKIADGPVLRRGTHARTVGSRRLHPDPVRQILAAGPRRRASKARSWSRSRHAACGPRSCQLDPSAQCPNRARGLVGTRHDGGIRLRTRDHQPDASRGQPHVLDVDHSERRSTPAKPMSSSVRSRGPARSSSHTPASRLICAVVRAADQRSGSPWVRAIPCNVSRKAGGERRAIRWAPAMMGSSELGALSSWWGWAASGLRDPFIERWRHNGQFLRQPVEDR